MTVPRISVIVPSFNQGKFLPRCIRSVREQEYPDVELIVIDGGSKDGTLRFLKRQQDIKWVSESDRGYADAVNKGLAMATGDIFAIQSSDDAYRPAAFWWAVATFKANPKSILAVGHQIQVDARGKTLRLNPTPEPIDLGRFIEAKTWVPQDAAFFRRGAIRDLRLNMDVDHLADYDLWIRMLEKGPAALIPAYVSEYTLHPNQRTADPRRVDAFVNDIGKILGRLATSRSASRIGGRRRVQGFACIWKALFLNRASRFAEASTQLRAALQFDPSLATTDSYQTQAKALVLAGAQVT